MIENTNKEPSVKFLVNKDNFNKLLEVLTFQEKNIVTNHWKNKVKELKEILLKYSIPQKDETGEISIIDIALFPKEASSLIVLLISGFDNLKVENNYTELIKKK